MARHVEERSTMATKRKQGTLESAAKTVKKTAKGVARAADEYVVEPVGSALGLTGKKRASRSKSAAHKKSSSSRPKKKTGTKSHSRKRTSKAKSR
jgi:hypothetical protein